MFSDAISAIAMTLLVLQIGVSRSHSGPSWRRAASAFPVAVFLLSIPLAFLSPTIALLSWLVLSPLGILINRRMPPEARTYFGE